MNNPTLTRSNYHTDSSNDAYFSVSQIKVYMGCPFRWWHQYVEHDWSPDMGMALLVGQYCDLSLLDPDAVFGWLEDNASDVRTKGGALRSEFVKADAMIAAIEAQPVLMDYLQDGAHHAIYTGTIWGHPFKAELDTISHTHKRIVDLKTAQALAVEVWLDWDDPDVPRKHFFFQRYWLQMSVYTNLVLQETGDVYDCYLVAGDKLKPPDVELYRFDNPDKMALRIERLKTLLDYMARARAGEIGTEHCGKCAVCRQFKVVNNPVIIRN